MATFFNQATLTYNDNVVNSNIVTGEIVEVLEAAKTATLETYSAGDEITYIVSIVNSGATAFTGLTITDNLGAYTFGTGTVVPLTYVDGSVRYFSDGVLQAAPTVVDTRPLTITGISVPANGNAIIVYKARANQFAPVGLEGFITNTAVISGAGLANSITVTDTVNAEATVNLSIIKSLTPETVAENGQLTYILTIQNTGVVPAEITDNLVVTDTFDPVLDPISVTFNGTPWTEGVNYTYDEASGQFATIAGQITVPGAVYTQDTATGAYVLTPGVSVIRVTGNV